jgi:diaminohydroxyphosphoribosylaminopyrimidine deaminase/5-amino-6-(5-phosphoribosylamino)uracil reductase
MQTAIALAQRGQGATWPNPSVGCVIVRDNTVVGRGRTGLRGRPHAETQALAMAGEAARGATAYVTLEPCSHHGHTPPCADALIAAGIARVVVACGDPDPRVNGAGIARLRAAGIQVETGVLEAEAQETLAGFFTRVRLGRPLITLKLASTLDGRIATATGESRWITSPESRRAVHALRGRHDGVMVGAETVAKDDPDLTCRIHGYAHRPTVRIVADSRLRTSRISKLVLGAHAAPTWLLYHTDSPADDADPALVEPGQPIPSRAQRLAESNARCILVPAGAAGKDTTAGAAGKDTTAGPNGIDLPEALRALGTRGLTRVLVEGGARLAASLLHADLVDRLVWFHAPGVMGSDGLPATAALGTRALADLRRFRRLAAPVPTGADVMTEYSRDI